MNQSITTQCDRFDLRVIQHATESIISRVASDGEATSREFSRTDTAVTSSYFCEGCNKMWQTWAETVAHLSPSWRAVMTVGEVQ